MAAFGWSAGDIVASVQLVTKIAGALKETNGAKSDYRESVDFLFGLEITLQNLRTIAPVIATPSQQDIIQFEAEKIAKPLSDFFAKVQKFDAALGLQSKRGAWRTARRKIQWAMDVSKEVQTLRDRISVPISSLNILLQSQTLHAISQLKERLPGDFSDKIASSIENAVSNGFRHELKTLKDSTKKYAENQESLIQEIGASIKPGMSGQDNHQLLTSTQSQQTDQASKRIAQDLKPQGIKDTINSYPTSSRLEQLIHDQSNDLKSLSMSLTTIVNSQGFPRNQSSDENVVTLRASISELKILFAKCMYLLALSLRELFNETLLYLGPQFLFFLMALKQFSSTMPRLLLADNILFEDFLGRRKYLPVEFFQHYGVFRSFLRESFEGVPGQKYVLNHQYRLNDANNNVVDSAMWSHTVNRRCKVTMSVVLDLETDEEMACPRCWTSEIISQPDVLVQCSTCDLIYRAPTTNKSLHGDSKVLLDSAEGLSGSSSGNEKVAAFEQEETARTEDLGNWGSTTVTEFSKTTEKSKPSNGWPGDTHNTAKVPWEEYEDLEHFKRVQIAEPKSRRSPQSSAFRRLISISYRLREEIWKAQSICRPGRAPEISYVAIDSFVQDLELCSLELFKILKDPSFEFFSPDTGLDGAAPLWSRAWADSTQLQEQSKELFKEGIRICQELKSRRISKLTWGDFDRDIATQKASEASRFYRSLHTFTRILFTLSEVDAAWAHGGRLSSRQIESPRSTEHNTEFEEGVATSLEVTPSHIIVALDTGTISIFNRDGSFFGTLVGHVKGVWAIAAHDDILVTGGVDRDVRVWRISTRESLYTLKGHTSTIRCLKFIDPATLVSGSRDTTMRIWDIEHGLCRSVSVGHQGSVRCLDTKGNIIVTGSYDTTVRVWSVSGGRGLSTLSGHRSQIYCIAFDGKRAVTGSLDATVRVWNISTKSCEAILHGHTSLVAHLQLRQDTLVTGAYDGSLRVWSLETMAPMHRLAAHDNSVTSLRFDHRRILSGSSDGKVKVWDLRTGALIRELGAPTEAVWKVHLEEALAVVIRGKGNKTVIEIWSFLEDADDFPMDGIHNDVVD